MDYPDLMFESIVLILVGILLPVLALRKVNISFSGTGGNNQGSFVNVTSDRLHIRKAILKTRHTSQVNVIGDAQLVSVDEVPVVQAATNDSRSHIMQVQAIVSGATGAIAAPPETGHMEFNRNDLVLEPDEALFVNTVDTTGAPTISVSLNLWYED